MLPPPSPLDEVLPPVPLELKPPVPLELKPPVPLELPPWPEPAWFAPEPPKPPSENSVVSVALQAKVKENRPTIARRRMG